MACGWSNVGGAADMAAALADESDTTYAQSPIAPSSSTLTVAPGATPLDASGAIVSTRLQVNTPTGVVPVLIELLEIVSGSPVVRSSRVQNATSGWNTFEWTLTSTENSSIVDRTKLQGRITAGV